MAEFGCSDQTVRSALRDLRRQRRIESKRGGGNWVAGTWEQRERISREQSLTRASEIAHTLGLRIRGGEYQATSELPRVRDLADEFCCRRGEMSHAIRLLRRQGLVGFQTPSGISIRYNPAESTTLSH